VSEIQKKSKVVNSINVETNYDDSVKQWAKNHLEEVMHAKTHHTHLGFKLPYRIFVPPDLDPLFKYPLFVHLHGRGERGSDNRKAIYLEANSMFTGSNSLVSPTIQKKFPCIVIVPQCSLKNDAEEWAHWVGDLDHNNGSYKQHPDPSESAQAVIELIAKIQTQYNIDDKRIYLEGLSMGGMGTWEFTMRWPDLFAAAVPMAGWSDKSKVDHIAHIPFWVFHGDNDKVNPVQGSRQMVDLLKTRGAHVRYSEYEGLGHVDSFYRGAEDKGLLPWIFSQQKK